MSCERLVGWDKKEMAWVDVLGRVSVRNEWCGCIRSSRRTCSRVAEVLVRDDLTSMALVDELIRFGWGLSWHGLLMVGGWTDTSDWLDSYCPYRRGMHPSLLDGLAVGTGVRKR